ncbi:hypothetical protein COCOBI_01-6250 [Coccomyxa sp. Obi]|nr:hypothetical protein COCOBI_01-6250 [Coccomyxa sp. Obi]
MRHREFRRRSIRRGDQSASSICATAKNKLYSRADSVEVCGNTWPGISIVLPVKGCRKHSLQNWKSQLHSKYSGPIEYLFVVDSQADPAYSAISDLLDSKQGANVKILIGVKATCTSQKICNLKTGILAANQAHKWLLCLDDDVLLHPTTLDDLIAAAEADPCSFMVTGYPFDVPEVGASLLTYCCLVYHLPLVIAFSVRQCTSFVWGGCMLLPLADLRSDAHGIIHSWSQGGYSDDLTVASICSEKGLQILCPSFAIFPQWLERECSPGRFWNYLRRQLYVMDTYANSHNEHLNHAMLALHCYLSWAFVAPAAISSLQVAAYIYQWISLGPHTASRPAMPCLAFFAAFLGAHVALLWMTDVILNLFSALDVGQRRARMGQFSWVFDITSTMGELSGCGILSSVM